jgi:hypothetical protein
MISWTPCRVCVSSTLVCGESKTWAYVTRKTSEERRKPDRPELVVARL